MLYLWVWELHFQAYELKTVKKLWVDPRTRIREKRNSYNLVFDVKWDRDIIKFLTDFTQLRGSYRDILGSERMEKIKENLKYFHTLIDLYVNWKKINIWKQLNLEEDKRLIIKASDNIKIIWSKIAVWTHNVANSWYYHKGEIENKYESKENNLNTNFFWEYLLTWDMQFTKILENNRLEKENKINNYWEILINQLQITHSFDTKSYNKLSIWVKWAMLKYNFNKSDKLQITNDEKN